MFGGIPIKEIDELEKYWNAFPNLRELLFKANSEVNFNLQTTDLKDNIEQHASVHSFITSFDQSFNSFSDLLNTKLIKNISTINISQEKEILSDNIFNRLKSIPLVDKYEAYELLDSQWKIISTDMEVIQMEGFESTKVVDPNMVIKKIDGKDQEVQQGWVGRVLPFKLVQENYLKEELQSLRDKESRLEEIGTEFEELIDSLTEEEKDSTILNDANDAFVSKEVNATLKEVFADVDSDEINALKAYMSLLDNKAKKPEKLAFIEANSLVKWEQIIPNRDATYGKSNVNKYITTLQTAYVFPEDSYESKIVKAAGLIAEEKELKKVIKEEDKALHNLTKTTIEQLEDEQVIVLLELKWVKPLVDALYNMPIAIVEALTDKVQVLAERYAITYSEVANDISQAENSLASLIGELDGNQYDMEGLKELKNLLKSED